MNDSRVSAATPRSALIFMALFVVVMLAIVLHMNFRPRTTRAVVRPLVVANPTPTPAATP